MRLLQLQETKEPRCARQSKDAQEAHPLLLKGAVIHSASQCREQKSKRVAEEVALRRTLLVNISVTVCHVCVCVCYFFLHVLIHIHSSVASCTYAYLSAIGG